jgi:hypothetical protein
MGAITRGLMAKVRCADTMTFALLTPNNTLQSNDGHVSATLPGVGGSPSKRTALLPMDKSKNIYIPRWIISVKRETDKTVKEFMLSLSQPDVKVAHVCVAVCHVEAL